MLAVAVGGGGMFMHPMLEDASRETETFKEPSR